MSHSLKVLVILYYILQFYGYFYFIFILSGLFVLLFYVYLLDFFTLYYLQIQALTEWGTERAMGRRSIFLQFPGENASLVFMIKILFFNNWNLILNVVPNFYQITQHLSESGEYADMFIQDSIYVP